MKRNIICLMVLFLFTLGGEVLAGYGIKRSIPLMTSGLPAQLCYNQQAHKIYCSLRGLNAEGVAVIDAGEEFLINTISLGMEQNPGEIVWASGPNRVYVNTDYLVGATYAIDGVGDNIIDTIGFGQGACDLSYNSLANKLYLGNMSDGLNINDAASGNPIKWISGFGGNNFYYPATNSLYAIGYLDTLAVINGNNDSLEYKIQVPGLPLSASMEANPDNRVLYITSDLANYVSAVDINSHSFITTIATGYAPGALAYCPTVPLSKVAVACRGSDSLYFIRADNTVGSLFLGDSIGSLIYNKKDSLLYCAGLRSHQVILVNPVSETVIGSILVGSYGQFTPTYMVADSSGDIYVSSPVNDFLLVLGKVPARMWQSNVMGGRWDDYLSWVYSDDGGNTWGNPLLIYPTNQNDSTIHILSGHTITIDWATASLTLNDLIVDGTIIQQGGSLTISDGPGNDLVVNGVYRLTDGELITDSGGQAVFADGSQYVHELNGGVIPRASWSPLSSIFISQIQNVAPAGLDQPLGMLHWDCFGQTMDLYLPSGPGLALSGLTVNSTGGHRLVLTNDLNPELVITGDLQIIDNNSFVELGGGGVRKLRILGDLSLFNAPPLGLYYSNNPGIDSLFLGRDYYYQIVKRNAPKGFAGPPHPDSAAIVFSEGGEHLYQASGDYNSGYVDMIVQPGNILRVAPGCRVGSGNLGRFVLMPGAALSTSDPWGAWLAADSGCVRSSGSRIYGPGAGFIFAESPDSIIAGDAVAGNLSFLKVDNSQGVILEPSGADITIGDSLVLSMGFLRTGAHTVYVNSGAAISVTSGQVIGRLAHFFPLGSHSQSYPVGDPGNYFAPVQVELINNTQPGFLTLASYYGPPPMVDSIYNCLQRYWLLSSPNVSCDQSRLSFSYLSGDFTPEFTEPVDETTMVAGRHSIAAGWRFPAVLMRNSGGINDGGSIELDGGSNFYEEALFVLGKDQASIHVLSDTTPPQAPLNLLVNGADPMPWTNNDTLTLTWGDPEPGISAGYYKIGAAPLNNYDTTGHLSTLGGMAQITYGGEGAVPIFVWLADSVGNTSYLNQATAMIRADKSAPYGAVVKPFGTDTIYGPSFLVRWSGGQDLVSGIMGWRLMSRVDTSAVWDTLASLVYDSSYSFVGGQSGHRYYFEAAACDWAGNWEALTGLAEDSVYVAPLTVDTVAPVVVSTEPVSGSSGIEWDFPIYIVFSEPVRKSSLSYAITPGIGVDSLVWRFDSTMVTIYHGLFVPATIYNVTVNSVVDTAGNHLGSSYSFWFSTRAIADTPYVSGTVPGPGQSDVPIGLPVTIRFSQPMDTASFRFSCSPTVAGWATSWQNGDSTVVLSHADFQYQTTYTFRVDSAVSKAGIPLNTAAAPNLPWSFTTVSGSVVMTTFWSGGAWRLFSVPVMPLDTSALAVLGDDLGAYADTTWRLVAYKPNSGYIERPSLYPGYGYWLASAADAAIDIQGSRITQPISLALDSGWNVVGNPYDTLVYISGFRVRWTDSLEHDLSYGDPSVNQVLRQVMWQYLDNTGDLVNNGYWDSLTPFSDNNRFQPWSGYAVYAVRPCTLLLNRVWKGKEGWRPSPTELAWRLELSAYSRKAADKGLVLGVSPQALTGYDRLDAEKPPLITENLSLYLPHHDWGQGPCHRYLHDFRPPGMEQRWLVRAEALGREPVKIVYNLQGRLEPGFQLYLVNRKIGQAQPAAESGAIDLMGGGEIEFIYSPRSLEALGLSPLEFGLTRIHPHPVTERATINYQLARPGHVRLKVYNALGQLTSVLVDERQEPGFHAAVWDGSRFASGIYLIRLEQEGSVRTDKMVKLR